MSHGKWYLLRTEDDINIHWDSWVYMQTSKQNFLLARDRYKFLVRYSKTSKDVAAIKHQLDTYGTRFETKANVPTYCFVLYQDDKHGCLCFTVVTRKVHDMQIDKALS